MPRRIGLTMEQWPQADRDAWNRAFEGSGYFDEQAVASHWRPKTRQQAQYAYGRWLAHVRARVPQVLSEPPHQRATIERVRAYIDQLSERKLTAMSIAAELQHLQLALGALGPDVDWGWLRQWQYAYQKYARPRDKRGKIVDPRLLLELGRALMDGAGRLAHAGERARQFRDGLIMALLISRPLRRRSFCALELGRTVHVTGDGYVIELHEHDTKAGHSVCFDVPDRLTNYLTRYVEQYRPLFPGARQTQALWLSAKGGPLGEDALYDMICRRTREAFGFSIHPHLFRDIAVTAIAREAPGSLAVARDLLTHTKYETTQQYYIQARSADAARVLATAVERLRSTRPGEGPHDG